MKKCFLTVLSTAVVLLLFAGCGGNNAKTGTESGKTFSMWVPLYSHIGQTANNFADVEFYKELEKRTGVHLTFVHPTVGQETQQFNIMVASNSMTDLVEYSFLGFKGGSEKAMQENVIVDLTPYMEHAPNLMEILKNNPDWDKQVKSDSGKYYTFPWLRGDDFLLTWRGPQIRKDYLDKLGLETPETIDDWETVLKGFKEKLNIQFPLTFDSPASAAVFMGAYGVSNEFYQENGQVKYGPLEPGYQKYLELFAKWYANGWLDSDYAMQDGKTYDAKVTSGKAGSFTGSLGGGMGRFLPILRENKLDAGLMGVKWPVLERGETPKFGFKDFNYIPSQSVHITTSCKDIETAVKFLDYGYGKEGHMLYNFGIEGVSYNMENNYPKYTDVVMKNPDGLAITNAMSRYAAAAYGGPFIQDKRYYEQYLPYPEQIEAINTWLKCDDSRRIPPTTMSVEESDKVASKMNEIRTYVQEMSIKLIMGSESMNAYPNFIDKLKSMGIEEVINAQQAALERYNNR